MTTAFNYFDEHIPAELIAQILNYLDFYSMLKCRAVCSKFQHVIDSSPHFHWKSELALAGMEDGGNYSLASSREMLAEHQAGWNSLRWTNEEWLEIQEYGYWELCGNVLAQQSEDGSALRFTQLPSKSREIKAAKWTVHGKILQMHDFCIDPSQDLLVIIEKPFWDQNDFMCRIFLWTLSTGEPHSSVAETHVLTHVLQEKQELMVDQQVIGICGDALGILFEHHFADMKEFVFWNWKTGEIIAHITAERVRSFTFLSERHVMFGDPVQPALVVVDIVAEDPQPQTLGEVEHAFTFHFPPMAVGAYVFSMKIRSDPAPEWKPGSKLSVPFFTARHNHLVFINIPIHRRGNATSPAKEVSLYAFSGSFLSLIENPTAQKSGHFDWLSWGPEGTRMILYHFNLLEHWMRYVYGTRHVSSRWVPGRSYIYMYDFNQLALRWSQNREKSDNVSLESGHTPDEPGEGESEAYIHVTEPTKITDCEIFEGEVESRLGYRMKRWPAPNRNVRTVMCTEDGIVIVYGYDIDEKYHIMTV